MNWWEKTNFNENDLQVQEQVEMSQIGQNLAMEVIRNGKSKVVEVKPGIFPESEG
ncbi:MAG: hypothetical protein HC930_16930 [Hydrococcus sp. SU_1_0]|nr:hypothetical protein [Hydrococcus sp. SU_1_0]